MKLKYVNKKTEMSFCMRRKYDKKGRIIIAIKGKYP